MTSIVVDGEVNEAKGAGEFGTLYAARLDAREKLGRIAALRLRLVRTEGLQLCDLSLRSREYDFLHWESKSRTQRLAAVVTYSIPASLNGLPATGHSELSVHS